MFEVFGIFLFCALIMFLDKRYGLGSTSASSSCAPAVRDDDNVKVGAMFTDISYSYMEGNIFHIDTNI